MRTAKTLTRLGKCQADLNLCWLHSHFVGFIMMWFILTPAAVNISWKHGTFQALPESSFSKFLKTLNSESSHQFNLGCDSSTIIARHVNYADAFITDDLSSLSVSLLSLSLSLSVSLLSLFSLSLLSLSSLSSLSLSLCLSLSSLSLFPLSLSSLFPLSLPLSLSLYLLCLSLSSLSSLSLSLSLSV